MNTETNHRIRLGIFVIVGSLLLIAGLYLIGKNRNLFGSTYRLTTRFDNVGGLQPGNNVRYSGIDIGTVEQINILNDTTIEVVMSVNEEMKDIIRSNSVTSIGTDGLMGNRLVNIEPGTSDATSAEEGESLPSIKSVDTEAMLRTLESTNRNIEQISVNLIEITNNINRSRGTLYTMLMDTTLASGLSNTLTNIESISENLRHFSEAIATMSDDVKSGKGALGSVIDDSSSFSKNLQETLLHLHSSSEQIESASLQINGVLDKIRTGKGTASILLNDTIMADQLKRSIQHIDSGTANFNQNMEALKGSFLTRGYFKRINRK
ncbi:MAG: MlaD family protein [Bacteroidota bacterium]